MKSTALNRLSAIALAVSSLLAIQNQLAAQNNKDKHHWHHHYKLIDLGTFGGSQSYINGFEYFGPLNNLNNAGMLTGWADTSTLDPYGNSSNAYGNFCFNYDGTPCYASHAFFWRDGFMFDLGTLPGGASSATTWISSNGLVAGVSQNGELDPLDAGSPTNFPVEHAVLWRNGEITDLGTLEGGHESGANAVNSRGQVVGWALNSVPDPNSLAFLGSEYNFYMPVYTYQMRAFLWQDGVMSDLGTLGTGTDAWAQAVNDKGQIIGISYTNTTLNQSCGIGGALIPTQDPFFWENGEMTDMGGLGGTCGFPYFLSDSGQVVGASDLAGDQASHPFVWEKGKGMKDLGTLGGNFGAAERISEHGVAVGGSTLPGDTQTDAFLWDGTMHDLGALDGCSYAFAVNAQRQVVGNWGGVYCAEGAFLWEDGGPMVDLSTLLSPASDLALGVVSNNDRGEIAGVGVDGSGNGHAIVLVPCDKNHSGIEGCDYTMVDTPAEAVELPTAYKASSVKSPAALWQRGNRFQHLGRLNHTTY